MLELKYWMWIKMCDKLSCEQPPTQPYIWGFCRYIDIWFCFIIKEISYNHTVRNFSMVAWKDLVFSSNLCLISKVSEKSGVFFGYSKSGLKPGNNFLTLYQSMQSLKALLIRISHFKYLMYKSLYKSVFCQWMEVNTRKDRQK